MKLTELLATREQELLQEIESLQQVEQSLKECREELDSVRKAQTAVDMAEPENRTADEPAVIADLLMLRQEFDQKYGTRR